MRVCAFFEKLLGEGRMRQSEIGKRMAQSDPFVQLVESKAIVKKRWGRGVVWLLIKEDVAEKYYRYYCPRSAVDPQKGERHNLVRTTRDSKSSPRESYRLAFIRSGVDFVLNSTPHSPQDAPSPFGVQVDEIKAEKVCFVENLENFMLDDRLISEGYVLIFPIGRLGTSFLKRVSAKELLHFPDLDYSGLNEFANIKAHFPNAKLYMPEEYFEDTGRYGKKITTKQRASRTLLRIKDEDPVLKRAFDFLQENAEFLEQEGYRG